MVLEMCLDLASLGIEAEHGGCKEIVTRVSELQHLRYHESINNLIPADACLGRRQTVLLDRERIKHKTIVNRRLLHRTQAA